MEGVFFSWVLVLCVGRWGDGEGFGVFSSGWAVSVLVMAWMGARRRLGCCVHWEYGCEDAGEVLDAFGYYRGGCKWEVHGGRFGICSKRGRARYQCLGLLGRAWRQPNTHIMITPGPRPCSWCPPGGQHGHQPATHMSQPRSFITSPATTLCIKTTHDMLLLLLTYMPCRGE